MINERDIRFFINSSPLKLEIIVNEIYEHFFTKETLKEKGILTSKISFHGGNNFMEKMKGENFVRFLVTFQRFWETSVSRASLIF